MELSGAHTFNAPRDVVWRTMLDPDVLRDSLPGCQRLELIGEDEYEATLKAGIAMIRGTFTGTVRITDKVEPESYTMHIAGKGPQGQVTGQAKITLTEQGEQTVVQYDGTGNVSGTIARVGARLIQPAAQMVAGQFFKDLEKKTIEAKDASSAT
jgi:carbon monoxide dehydrogenase subunit G